ncbi:hypothetical protein FRC11_008572 [Ceratobasidium sp. 423]|nr:hypothetical protein FRC11_008572 [Ceratobasidium sp. 423]
MDQDDFRLLLNASKSSGGSATQSKAYNRGSLLTAGSSSAKPTESPQTTFKPRKVKKAVDSRYRDRAAERRGGANEYAEVEGLLEDFEKQMAGEKKEVVDERRKYLGGDATHTVLVKGLDFALLEQQRAREESRNDLDDDLEAAFQGEPVGTSSTEGPSTATQSQGKKRTRAELLAELKQSREADANQGTKVSTKEEEIEALERAKQAGKFKPMGSSSFAPVEKKKKKKKVIAEEGKPQAKETKANSPGVGEKMAPPANTPSQEPATTTSTKNVDATQDAGSKLKANEVTPSIPSTSVPPPTPSIEEIEDVDPFADAGDYEPDYGDDSDAEEKPKDTSQPAPTPGRRNWFNDPEPEPEPKPAKPPTPPPKAPEETEPEPGPARSTRLEGLSSSAMPSISEFLAMDKEEEAREKKKARKEKNKKKAA